MRDDGGSGWGESCGGGEKWSCSEYTLKVKLTGVKQAKKNPEIFKKDNQQGPTVQHRELCSMLCGSLDGKGVSGRMDTCIYMAESLYCSSETIIT